MFAFANPNGEIEQELLKPTMTLNETNIYQIEVHSNIPEFKAVAKDSNGKELKVDIKHNINNAVLGTYKVTFKAVDQFDNEEIIEREFKVVDTTRPVIRLIGRQLVKRLIDYETYTDEGANVTDNYDAPTTTRGIQRGTNTVAGIYTLRYNHTDSSGNRAFEVVRSIKMLAHNDDEDGDGYTNLEEYNEGTNYDDPNDNPNWKWTVTFDSDGGSLVESQTVEHNKQAVKPIDPIKKGYKIDSWTLDGEVFNFATPLKKDITLVAKWVIDETQKDFKYVIKYYLDETTDPVPGITTPVNGTGYIGEVVTLTHPTTDQGYKLKDEQPTTITVLEDNTASVTVYYEIDETQWVTVDFSAGANGTIGAFTPVKVLKAYALNASVQPNTIVVPTTTANTGYKFNTWSPSFAQSNIVTIDTTYVAQWTPNTDTAYKVEHYQQKLDLSGYDLTDTDNETGTTGATVTAEVKTYAGFTYDESVAETVKSGEIAGNGSLTLKLYYKRNTETAYKVRHLQQNVSGDEYAQESEEDKTGTTGALTEAVAKSYTGFTAQELTQQTIAADGSTIVEIKYDRNVHEVVYKITGTIDANDNYATESYRYGAPVTLKDKPTKTGHTFNGWTGHETPMPNKDVEITGNYTINQYTITFNTDGGNTISPITQNYGTAITPPANPTKTNYTFVKWEPVIPATMPASDLTVKAIWKANQIGIRAEISDNAQLLFTHNHNYDIKNYIEVYALYADGTEILVTDYTTNFTTANIGVNITLTITHNGFVANNLKYTIIADIAYQTKFELKMPTSGNNGYYKTTDSNCKQDCDVAPNITWVSKTTPIFELIEHYVENISISSVKVLYEGENNYVSTTVSNVVRWSRKTSSGWTSTILWDPVRIVDFAQNKTVDKVEVTYHRAGVGSYKITFKYNTATNEFKAISEVPHNG